VCARACVFTCEMPVTEGHLASTLSPNCAKMR